MCLCVSVCMDVGGLGCELTAVQQKHDDEFANVRIYAIVRKRMTSDRQEVSGRHLNGQVSHPPTKTPQARLSRYIGHHAQHICDLQSDTRRSARAGAETHRCQASYVRRRERTVDDKPLTCRYTGESFGYRHGPENRHTDPSDDRPASMVVVVAE